MSKKHPVLHIGGPYHGTEPLMKESERVILMHINDNGGDQSNPSPAVRQKFGKYERGLDETGRDVMRWSTTDRK